MSGAHAPTTSPATQRELHVLAVERPRQRTARHPQSLSEPEREVVARGCRGSRRCAASSAGGAVEQHRALQHDDPVEVVGDRAELVRHEQHRARRARRTRCTSESRKSRCDSASTPAIGSSSTSSSGSPTSALAMSTRCCWPPDSSLHAAGGAGRRARPTSSAWSTASRSRGAGPPPPPAPGQAAGARRPPRPWPGGPAASAAAAGT